ncbi:GcrA family cell cycle regulator [Mesorhizobium sp. B2-3-5]|uniref:GcrA family cell cycle regulator n=1 Tax=Mesorhizobium sp. B2-3-5 TaxID=2589958 RepID=UPI001126C13D|nr:GcrA family cell cycle regulator [Mesorhizobium sp. B2-3-5]TPM13091.1 GcrA cell cycle regulator [Mesorhizobium sp. B2-3-5]
MASYSDAELQEIARWLKEGLSASKIAAAFSTLRGSPVSRNAIIGIVHRNAMLDAIGFANGKGMPPAARQVAGERAKDKRTGGTQASGRTKGKATGKAAAAVKKGADVPVGKGVDTRKAMARVRHDASPVWLPPRLFVREVGVLIADGEAYRFKVPAPQRGPIGRQPHGVAMRFIDCLFGRCRAPLDLTLEEDPENDAPGGRPGADMLCCGMRTKAMKSYCGYHQARFRRRVCEAG